jgi:hypothetical protein
LLSRFVDFGSRLVSKSREVYKSQSGTLKSNADLEITCTRLKSLAAPLAEASNDAALSEICKGCVEISDDLVLRLENLKVPAGHKYKRWKSFRQALKSVWQKERVQEVKQRLDDYRLQLDTLVGVSLGDDF